MRLKKTLLAISVLTTLVSMNSMAAPRANSLVSDATVATVGHRPVATTSDKKLTVTGSLLTGETLKITDVAFTDSDAGDETKLDLTSMTDNIEWFIVENDTSALATASGKGLTFTIPGTATGKKIKVRYRILTDKKTTNPYEAMEQTVVLLTTTTSGVEGPGSADGTVAGKLTSVTLKAEGTPTVELNGTATAGTPIVGKKITAELTCPASVDTKACSPESYNFQWQIADNGSSTWTNITPTGGAAHEHVVQGDQQNKLFRVEVSPKTATPPSSKERPRR
ncbi:ZirU family protein [Citrobacter freundii]|uniref:ZirU family protein n=1 Tax=Citrobacter freundii TaxID=546 RepID=UPI00397A0913